MLVHGEEGPSSKEIYIDQTRGQRIAESRNHLRLLLVPLARASAIYYTLSERVPQHASLFCQYAEMNKVWTTIKRSCVHCLTNAWM